MYIHAPCGRYRDLVDYIHPPLLYIAGYGSSGSSESAVGCGVGENKSGSPVN